MDQKVERGLVGPVQVLEYDEQRASLAEPDEELAQRVEEPPLLLLGVEGRRGNEGRTPDRELGHELDDLAAEVAQEELRLRLAESRQQVVPQ